MTSYVPSITLPGQIFAQPAASILLPIVLGTSVGFAVRRKSLEYSLILGNSQSTHCFLAACV